MILITGWVFQKQMLKQSLGCEIFIDINTCESMWEELAEEEDEL